MISSAAEELEALMRRASDDGWKPVHPDLRRAIDPQLDELHKLLIDGIKVDEKKKIVKIVRDLRSSFEKATGNDGENRRPRQTTP